MTPKNQAPDTSGENAMKIASSKRNAKADPRSPLGGGHQISTNREVSTVAHPNAKIREKEIEIYERTKAKTDCSTAF
jgi:hypothetical protein